MASKAKLKWKDISSGEPGSTYETLCGSMRVVVTRHIDYGPKAWLLRLGFNGRELGDLTAEAAQVEAEKYLTTFAKQMLAALK